MSKTGDYHITMKEDALSMTLSQFVAKYGNHNAVVWTEVNLGTHGEPDPEQYYYPGSDCQDAF